MRFKGLDLNLLVAFNVLLETRSVSRAAEHMNLSQPAMSAALNRLREYFSDDILITHKKQMHPTPYAESLVPYVKACLGDIEKLLSTSNKFDPVTSQRTFKIVASDYITIAVLAPLIEHLTKVAPGVKVDAMLPADESVGLLQDGKIDILIVPEEFLSEENPAELLFEERHVVVGSAENPAFEPELTKEEYIAAGHVAVIMGNRRPSSFADRQLALMGHERKVEVTTASFSAVPWLLMGTKRMALMHERLAKVMVERFPIRYTDVPFAFPVMREMLQYHQAHAEDDGLIWLREQLAYIVKHTH